jgi:hypothetical protein
MPDNYRDPHVWSSLELAISTKFSIQMTPEWRKFEESVAGIAHCVAIAGQDTGA